MKFKSPFWSRSEGNKAKPILYGKHEGKISGAVGLTDNHLAQVREDKQIIIVCFFSGQATNPQGPFAKRKIHSSRLVEK